MKKMIGLLFCLLILGSVFCFATGKKDVDSQEVKTEEVKPIILKLAENQPKDYPTTLGDQKFADLVKERTNGRIIIEVYHSKQLGEEKTVIEQVQLGAIDFARVSISPIASFYKPLDALQMPYLYRNDDHMWKVLKGSVGEKLLNSIASAGFIGLCYYSSGERSFYTKKPVNSPEDLKGMKIRVQESALMVGLVKALGAVPQPLPFGEVYSALQTGVIDGAENNWPSYYSTGHYEVAKYYILDQHTRVPEIMVASKKVFDTLSKDDQAIVKQAAKESVDYQRQKWADYVKVSETAVREAGNTITPVPDNSAFQVLMQPLYDNLPADAMALVEEIRAVK